MICHPDTWRKSSYSGTNGEADCVEVALTSQVAAVRDSKNAAGPSLAFPSATWRMFLGVVRG
jgi:hypothetical protein